MIPIIIDTNPGKPKVALLKSKPIPHSKEPNIGKIIAQTILLHLFILCYSSPNMSEILLKVDLVKDSLATICSSLSLIPSIVSIVSKVSIEAFVSNLLAKLSPGFLKSPKSDSKTSLIESSASPFNFEVLYKFKISSL